MPRSRRKRQRVEWYRECGITAFTSTASTIVVPNTEVREGTGQTLVRVRGSALGANATANEVIVMGLIVINESAVASAPRPASEFDADWLLLEYLPSLAAQAADGRFFRLPIDNRAMRKLNEDEVVLLVFENCVQATASSTVAWGLSFLLKQV